MFVSSGNVAEDRFEAWADPNWRSWRIENIRRSLSMDRSGGPPGISKDEAMRVIEYVQFAEERLRQLRADLQRIVNDLSDPFP